MARHANRQEDSSSNVFGLCGLIFSCIGWLSCGILSPFFLLGAFLSFLGLFSPKPKSLAIAGLIVGFPGTIMVGGASILTVFGLGAAAVATVSSSGEPEPSIAPTTSNASAPDGSGLAQPKQSVQRANKPRFVSSPPGIPVSNSKLPESSLSLIEIPVDYDDSRPGTQWFRLSDSGVAKFDAISRALVKVEKSEAYGWTVFVDDLETEDPVTFVAGRGYDPDSEDIAIRHAEVICKIIVDASEKRHDAFVVFKKNRLFQPSIESARGLLWLESADDLREAEDICDRALAMIDSALLPLAKKQEAEVAKLAQQEELRKRKLAENAYELKHPKPVKPETELLTWTSIDGKFTIDAHAIDGSSELGDEWVTLRKQDGVVKTIPLIRLAAKDRYIVYDYVEKTLATFEAEVEQWEAAKQAALHPKASSPTKPSN